MPIDGAAPMDRAALGDGVVSMTGAVPMEGAAHSWRRWWMSRALLLPIVTGLMLAAPSSSSSCGPGAVQSPQGLRGRAGSSSAGAGARSGLGRRGRHRGRILARFLEGAAAACQGDAGGSGLTWFLSSSPSLLRLPSGTAWPRPERAPSAPPASCGRREFGPVRRGWSRTRRSAPSPDTGTGSPDSGTGSTGSGTGSGTGSAAVPSGTGPAAGMWEHGGKWQRGGLCGSCVGTALSRQCMAQACEPSWCCPAHTGA